MCCALWTQPSRGGLGASYPRNIFLQMCVSRMIIEHPLIEAVVNMKTIKKENETTQIFINRLVVKISQTNSIATAVMSSLSVSSL